MKKYKRPLTTEELQNFCHEDIDFSDIAETTRAFWKDAKVIFPEKKEHLSVRIDADVVDFFKEMGKVIRRA